MSILRESGIVFDVPINEELHSFGQIIAQIRSGVLYGIFYAPMSGTVSLTAFQDRQVVEAPVVAGIFLDAKLHNGTWSVLGKSMPPEMVSAEPRYCVEIGGKICAESLDGRRHRAALPSEIKSLSKKIISSPVRMEKVLRAYAELEDWDASYDDYLYKNIARSTTVQI